MIIGAVFSTVMGPSLGPDILLFKKFQYQWKSVDKTKFLTGDANDKVSLSVRDYKSEILKWEKLTLEQKNLCGDYCELFEMSIVFLSDIPFWEIHFHASMHRAR